MVAERPRPSRSETGSAMARPRRSRSLREELAEAEAEVQDTQDNVVKQDDDAEDMASVQSTHTPIRPSLKSVKPQRAQKDNDGEKVKTPKKLSVVQGEANEILELQEEEGEEEEPEEPTEEKKTAVKMRGPEVR